jgi:sugar (pentulose or hexulose) kinase
MSEKYLIGIDSGTQSTRAALFDTQGNRIAIGQAEYPKMLSPQRGWQEYTKNDIGDGMKKAITAMLAGFKGNAGDIAAVGLTSQRCVFIALDKSGQMLYNPISWMDQRWQMNVPAMGKIETTVQDFLYQVFLPYYSKANWFKHYAPEVYEKADKYLGVSGYLGYKLTGNFCKSLSNSYGWPYDPVNWSAYKGDDEIKLLGMRRDQIPEPVLSGTAIGTITPAAAAEFGLPQGIPVVMGPADKQAELLGAGAIKNKQAYVTMGTLTGLDIVSDEYKPAPDFSYNIYLSACPKLYNYEAPVNKGFWLISWFRDNLAGGLLEEAKNKNVSIESLLDKAIASIPPGSEGLVVLPDWAPEVKRPNSKGLFLGFDERHTRSHMFRALLEGIMIQIKLGSNNICQSLDMAINELSIGGGGSKSNTASQVIADIFNVPVYRVKESENCSLGAAMCAAVGSGIYASLPQSVEKMVKKYDEFRPDAKSHDFYAALSEKVIQKLYPAMADVLKELAELTTAKS